MESKRLTKLILYVFAICCSTAVVNAQNTVSGIIKAADTNESFIGANVVIKNTTIGSQTDVNGKFSIKSPQAFPWTLVITHHS